MSLDIADLRQENLRETLKRLETTTGKRAGKRKRQERPSREMPEMNLSVSELRRQLKGLKESMDGDKLILAKRLHKARKTPCTK